MPKKATKQIDEKTNPAYNPDDLSVITDEKKKMFSITYPNAIMLNKKEISDLLSVSINKVNSLISEGTLRAKKIGERTVIPLSDYLSYCEHLPDKESDKYGF